MKALISLFCGVLFWVVFYRAAIGPWCPGMWAGTAPPFVIISVAASVYGALRKLFPSDEELEALPVVEGRGSDGSENNKRSKGNRGLMALLGVCLCYLVFQLTIGMLLIRQIDALNMQLDAMPADVVAGQKRPVEINRQICSSLAENGASRFISRVTYPFAAYRADQLRKSYHFELFMTDGWGRKKCLKYGQNIVYVTRIGGEMP